MGKKGSTVVICTDGLSNIGVCSMESDIDKIKCENEFDKIIEICKYHGVRINVITLKGE